MRRKTFRAVGVISHDTVRQEMAIRNPRHVSEGRVKFVLSGGIKLDTIERLNDPFGEVFWIEHYEGCFEPIPYVEMISASISLSAPERHRWRRKPSRWCD
jgi:hypothetical protein